jgi:hypothetical protein
VYLLRLVLLVAVYPLLLVLFIAKIYLLDELMHVVY